MESPTDDIHSGAQGMDVPRGGLRPHLVGPASIQRTLRHTRSRPDLTRSGWFMVAHAGA